MLPQVIPLCQAEHLCSFTPSHLTPRHDRRTIYSMETSSEHHIAPQETLAKADSVLPRFDGNDESKRAYLSYRLCGFGRQEACNYTKTKKRQVYYWMSSDAVFEDIEKRQLLDLRQTFSKQIITLDFTRNFKLALERDRVVLDLAVTNPAALSKADQEYLVKIRSMYTPQQLQILEGFFRSDVDDLGFDELVIRARRYYGRDTPAENQYANPLPSGQAEYSQSTVVSPGLTGGEEEEYTEA